VDDFGTGFNSLTALRDLPIDKLTIDRAFIPAVSPDDRSTVPAASTIALTHRISPRVETRSPRAGRKPFRLSVEGFTLRPVGRYPSPVVRARL